MINDPLFETEDYFLSAIDYEKDPQIDSQYSLNLRYARHWSDGIAKPFSTNEFKKKYEKIEKSVDESGSVIHFAVRTRVDHHLIWFLRINVMWKPVSLTVFKYNPRGVRSYEKAGFKMEGVQHQFLNRDGRRWNMYRMGILKSEWLELSRKG